MSDLEKPRLQLCDTGVIFALDDFAVVGRGPAVQLRIEGQGVSREHASLRRRGSVWRLKDLGSSNGTFVNGLPAGDGVTLRDGDEVSFGPVRCIFHQPPDSSEFPSGAPTDVTIVGSSRPGVEAVTLLAGDLRGFSELSARLPANVIAHAVSGWCGHCREVLAHHGAHLDQFIGDAVFAWWRGTSIAVKSRALAAARVLAEHHSFTDLPDSAYLRCGIGLHTGDAALSRSGPASFTLIGANVNMVFRIESLTRKLEEPVIVSREFTAGWEATAPWTFPALGCHEIKGWDQPVEVFAVRTAENRA